MTYSRTNLSPEEVLLQLKQKFDFIEKYVISQEEHSEEPEKGKHIHAYISFYRKVNITCQRKLDLVDPNSKEVYHGQYEAVKNRLNCIQYVKKDGNYICNFETNFEFEVSLQKIASENGLTKAMEYFCSKRPELISTRYNSVKSNLKSFLELKKGKNSVKYDNFSIPTEILNWFENERDKKTLFLTGKSGVGKTSCMLHLLDKYNPLLVRNLNSLKNLKDSNQAVILDDLDWKDISREEKIHLLDKDYESIIRVLYGTVSLSPDLIKVVTSNNPSDLINLWDNNDAISRRITHVDVQSPMFVQNNVTINISINK